MTPYEATFGIKPRVGLESYFPSSIFVHDHVYNEEDLEEMLQGNNSQTSETTQSISQDEGSFTDVPSLGMRSD